LYRIFDPSRFYSNSPSWYPMINGHRACPTNDDAQLCLSATGTVQRAVDAATEAFSRSTRTRTFALGINDSSNWCECADCKALAPAPHQALPAGQRSWSEPYWRWVNAIASEVARPFPDARLGALAYCAADNAPSFDLRPNVFVFLCQDTAQHFDAGYRAGDLANQQAWLGRCDHVFKYAYLGLATWVFPQYCLRQFAEDIRTACTQGIRGYYIEHAAVPWTDGGQLWVVARMLWNPWLDPEALETEFCRVCFGPAAPEMKEYFRMLQEVWESPKKGRWFDGFSDIGQQAQRYPRAVRMRLQPLLTRAREKAGNDTNILARVDAIAGALSVASAFTREAELVAALGQLPTNAAELAEAKERLTALTVAVKERDQFLAESSTAPWSRAVQKALATSSSLVEWNLYEDRILHSTSNALRAIENAASDLLPADH
jgi:hypothetical protein